MKAAPWDEPIELFSTCPPSTECEGELYLRRVAEVARWSERHGCTGILVYTDNRLVDPWLLSQVIVQNTERLSPLVAVQPVYMHPYTVAKKVASFGHLYGRRIYLNMVAGGFRNDLIAMGDDTPHDRRYDRLREYTRIITQLLAGEAVSLDGEFCTVRTLRMTPPLAVEHFPKVFVSASSEAGRAAAADLGAVAISYPKPPGEEEGAPKGPGRSAGIRVGVIARDDGRRAWEVARGRFPEDRKGQLTHQLAMKVSDSAWHEQLSDMDDRGDEEANPYWLVPFKNYKTMCPYLVGSYDRVAEELSRYLALGYRTFILDVPAAEEELGHTRIAFDRALARAGA